MSKLKLFLAMVAFVATLPIATEALAVPDHCWSGYTACLAAAGGDPDAVYDCVEARIACENY